MGEWVAMMKWMVFSSEIYYLLVGLWFLALSMLPNGGSRRNYFSALFLAAAGILVCLITVRSEGVLFFNAYQVNLFSQVFKILLSLGLFLVICLCPNLTAVKTKHHPEFYLLLFVCTLAMMMLVSAVHLLTIYVALELSSYSLYILVALQRRQETGLEATLKYFLVGVCASAAMLFGLAVLYGSVKAVYLSELVQVLPTVIDRPLVVIGLLLSLGGFFFKLAVFPFHFWAPDVYQGATNQVTAYIATASKVAAIALLIRMVATAGSGAAGNYLAHALVTLAIVSMTVGNLAAIVQQDMKRLLAYSTVAHAGYLLIGVVASALVPQQLAAVLFYLLAYAMTTIGARIATPPRDSISPASASIRWSTIRAISFSPWTRLHPSPWKDWRVSLIPITLALRDTRRTATIPSLSAGCALIRDSTFHTASKPLRSSQHCLRGGSKMSAIL